MEKLTSVPFSKRGSGSAFISQYDLSPASSPVELPALEFAAARLPVSFDFVIDLDDASLSVSEAVVDVCNKGRDVSAVFGCTGMQYSPMTNLDCLLRFYSLLLQIGTVRLLCFFLDRRSPCPVLVHACGWLRLATRRPPQHRRVAAFGLRVERAGFPFWGHGGLKNRGWARHDMCGWAVMLR